MYKTEKCWPLPRRGNVAKDLGSVLFMEVESCYIEAKMLDILASAALILILLFVTFTIS